MKFLKFWFPVILYSGIIFYASSIPDPETPISGMHFDVLLHIILYVPFGWLTARAVSDVWPSMSGKELMIAVFFIAMLYGISDEYHQMYVAGRSAELKDLIADIIGGTLGGYVYQLFINRPKKL